MNITTIETKRLTIRPFTQEDAHAAAKWIDRMNGKCPVSETSRIFVIKRKEDNICIGLVGYAPKAEINNEIEILYAVSDLYQGSGYATEAAKALIWYAFEIEGLEMLSALVKPENTASRKVIEKLGFAYGDTRKLNNNGEVSDFDYFRLYHLDHIPSPEWNFSGKAEEMAAFFDTRADGYDSHMLNDVTDSESYKRTVLPVTYSTDEINILDIGCGTGIELEYLFERVPNAWVTCIDLAKKMLEILKARYLSKARQIDIICGSYIDWKYPNEFYDYVISSNTMHHFFEDVKIGIYRNIVSSLKPGGLYIESDFIVDRMMMEQYQARYQRIIKTLADKKYSGYYHIDIPFTVDIQKELLLKAGFSDVSVFYENIKPSGSGAILVARR